MSQQETKDMAKHFYRASAADFMKIPGGPIIYDVSESVYTAFEKLPSLIKKHHACSGLQTGNNDLYLLMGSKVSEHHL